MAPSTRKTSRVEKTPSDKTKKKNSQAKSGTLQKRLLAELHTEGTGLKGDFPEKRPAVYYHGAWYEDEAAESEPPRAETRKRRRPRDESQGLERASKRTRRPSRRTRENNFQESRASQDETFRKETASQLRASKAAKHTIRRRDIERILPFLDAMSLPVSADSPDPEAADLFLLDKTEARRLLSSTETVRIPVFVPGGAPPLFDPAVDPRRPLEQVLDHFHHPTETDETTDTSKRPGTDNDVLEVKLSDLRARFLTTTTPPSSSTSSFSSTTYPYNFPDIPNPLLDPGVPQFVSHARTALLKTLVRSLLPLDPHAVCPETCRRARHASLKCGRHALSRPELVHLQSGWLHWQGTLMLAEAGALTRAHWDKWGFATWIACHEGEMGFAWLSRPRDDGEWTGWMRGAVGDDAVVEGRWVFVVLRAGDALYMPSGTVHLVFRRPEGGPTLGMAGHVVRGPDVVAWLRALRLEVEDEIRNPDVSVPYGEVVPCLVAGLKVMIERDDLSEREIEDYGGRENLDEARLLLERIEGLVDEL